MIWDTSAGDWHEHSGTRSTTSASSDAVEHRRGLARAGLLDKRHQTSASDEYLMATGYAGGDHYVNERAVVDGDLITAGPQSPVQFACATLARVGLASDRTLEAYEGVFHRADPDAFPVLMQAQNAA